MVCILCLGNSTSLEDPENKQPKNTFDILEKSRDVGLTELPENKKPKNKSDIFEKSSVVGLTGLQR